MRQALDNVGCLFARQEQQFTKSALDRSLQGTTNCSTGTPARPISHGTVRGNTPASGRRGPMVQRVLLVPVKQ
jgi:hypothetical protein